MINVRGGLFNPNSGVLVEQVTKNENEMSTHAISITDRPDTIGVYRPSSGRFYLRNSNMTGVADIGFNFGLPWDQPIVGDWVGNGVKTVGVYRPSNGKFYFRNSNTRGFSDITVSFGPLGGIPIVGDWDGDGIDTVGISLHGFVYLRNSNTNGPADMTFDYGIPGDVPIAGDWDGLP